MVLEVEVDLCDDCLDWNMDWACTGTGKCDDSVADMELFLPDLAFLWI